MKLHSWNVNGIRAVLRKDLFHPFVKTAKPDILCIQETKAQPGEAVIGLPQYREIWNSAEKKGYAGTAILSKTKPISINRGLPLEIQTQFGVIADNYGNPNNEGRVVSAEIHPLVMGSDHCPISLTLDI